MADSSLTTTPPPPHLPVLENHHQGLFYFATLGLQISQCLSVVFLNCWGYMGKDHYAAKGRHMGWHYDTHILPHVVCSWLLADLLMRIFEPKRYLKQETITVYLCVYFKTWYSMTSCVVSFGVLRCNCYHVLEEAVADGTNSNNVATTARHGMCWLVLCSTRRNSSVWKECWSCCSSLLCGLWSSPLPQY